MDARDQQQAADGGGERDHAPQRVKDKMHAKRQHQQAEEEHGEMEAKRVVGGDEHQRADGDKAPTGKYGRGQAGGEGVGKREDAAEKRQSASEVAKGGVFHGYLL